jgi:hypothetical protein
MNSIFAILKIRSIVNFESRQLVVFKTRFVQYVGILNQNLHSRMIYFSLTKSPAKSIKFLFEIYNFLAQLNFIKQNNEMLRWVSACPGLNLK